MHWSVRIAHCRAIAVLVVGMFAFSTAAVALPVGAVVSDAVCPAQTGWIPYFNTFRSAANLPAVTEDTALETGDCNHSRYVVKNSITHVEDPGNAWYTASGAYAGQHSNVAIQFGSTFTYQDALDEWMTGPFHETGMLDPRLTQSGLGIYAEGGTSGATLDVLSHLSGPAPSTPTYFPANNKQMTLRQYGGNESPDPLSGCGGYTAPTGPPLSLQLLTTPAVTAVAFSKVGVGSLSACEFDETNYTNPDGPSQTLARQILGGRHAIILMPQAPLTDGTYQVTVVSNGTTYSWSFFVGAGVIPPSPNARPVIFRTNAWYFRNTLSGGTPDNAFPYGAPGDTPLICDWDGNGSRSVAIVRKINGSLLWYTRNSNAAGNPDNGFLFGSDTDTPVCGDWDGNGTETPGLARPSGGSLIWILSNAASGSGPYTIFAFGANTDTPVVGDWNGDHTATVGIARGVGSSLLWYLRDTNSTGNPDYSFLFGANTDTPVVGDWDGNGTMTAGIVRQTNGALLWYLRNTLNTGPVDASFLYGAGGDVPLVWFGSGANGQGTKKK